MLNSDDWSYGFYGYDADNAGTLFVAGVPYRDRVDLGRLRAAVAATMGA